VNYFAYGSNMSSTVMADRCPGATALGPARLDDHRLGFRLPSLRWGGYAADIVNDDGVTTWGVLWKLSEEHLETLDQLEARYDRYAVLPVNGRPVAAMTYRVKPELVVPDGGSPTSEYLQHLIDGALEHGLPGDYLRQLESGRQSTEY
jgi:gamma-glutamylcyclotransferase (GGCT)/AIG2-like uncharacterized protein YtfP